VEVVGLGWSEGLVFGLALGLSFNPLTAILGSSVGAALSGSPRSGDKRLGSGLTVLAVAWLLGDGFRVMARLRDALDGVWPSASADTAEVLVVLVGWAVAGAVVGYLVPFVFGRTVGRRVTHGTGWLTAGSLAAAATVTMAISGQWLGDVMLGLLS